MSSMGLNPLDVVERQSAIIQIQSGVIDELFLLLMQYISTEEADSLPVVGKINKAASLRQGMEGGEV